MADPRTPVRCWSCLQAFPLVDIGAHVQACLTAVIARREHAPDLFGQQMFWQPSGWWVWIRTDEPPYHRGAERFRPWRPRHLHALWQQWRWDRRHLAATASLRYWHAHRRQREAR